MASLALVLQSQDIKARLRNVNSTPQGQYAERAPGPGPVASVLHAASPRSGATWRRSLLHALITLAASLSGELRN